MCILPVHSKAQIVFYIIFKVSNIDCLWTVMLVAARLCMPVFLRFWGIVLVVKFGSHVTACRISRRRLFLKKGKSHVSAQPKVVIFLIMQHLASCALNYCAFCTCPWCVCVLMLCVCFSVAKNMARALIKYDKLLISALGECASITFIQSHFKVSH